MYVPLAILTHAELRSNAEPLVRSPSGSARDNTRGDRQILDVGAFTRAGLST
jgi:hypothetical protein